MSFIRNHLFCSHCSIDIFTSSWWRQQYAMHASLHILKHLKILAKKCLWEIWGKRCSINSSLALIECFCKKCPQKKNSYLIRSLKLLCRGKKSCLDWRHRDSTSSMHSYNERGNLLQLHNEQYSLIIRVRIHMQTVRVLKLGQGILSINKNLQYESIFSLQFD